MENKSIKTTLSDHILAIFIIMVIISGLSYVGYYLFFRGYKVESVKIKDADSFIITLDRHVNGYASVDFTLISKKEIRKVMGTVDFSDKKESLGTTCKKIKMSRNCDYFYLNEFKPISAQVNLNVKGVFGYSQYKIDYSFKK